MDSSKTYSKINRFDPIKQIYFTYIQAFNSGINKLLSNFLSIQIVVYYEIQP